jgi:hypothetical protein
VRRPMHVRARLAEPDESGALLNCVRRSDNRLGNTTAMARWLPVAAAIALSGCNQSRPLDCKAIEQAVFTCLERHKSPDQLRRFRDCVPLAKPEKFRGTWAQDFEFNKFYNGKQVSPSQAWQFPIPSTGLVTEGSRLEHYAARKMAAVLDVSFIGRRTACNLTEPYRQIVVDHVIDVKEIEVRPWNY